MLHFNPQRVNAARLDRLTRGEHATALIERLTCDLRGEVGAPLHQHHMVVGPRGAGKTHLLRVVAASRLPADPMLAKAFWPVVLPEEVGLRSPADLPLRVLERLAADLEQRLQSLVAAPPSSGGPQHEPPSLTDDTGAPSTAPSALARARSACLEALAAARRERDPLARLRLGLDGVQQTSVALSRTLLTVVENLDSLLYTGAGGGRQRMEQEHWALRTRLQESSSLLLLGSAVSVFGAVAQQDGAFYDFFRIHRLSELHPDEVLSLVRARLDEEHHYPTGDQERQRRVATLVANFERHENELRGLLVITGGLPRFAHLLYDVLVEVDVSQARSVLDSFLDELTPYFQQRLDPRLLPAPEADLLHELATAWGPLQPRELADRLYGATPGEVAVLLGRLQARGLVQRSGSPSTRGRAVTWDLTEPLYRVWTQFRGGEGAERFLLLARFVAALFSTEDLLRDRQRLQADLETARDPRRADCCCESLQFVDHALECKRAHADGEALPLPGLSSVQGTEQSPPAEERLEALVLDARASAGLGEAAGEDEVAQAAEERPEAVARLAKGLFKLTVALLRGEEYVRATETSAEAVRLERALQAAQPSRGGALVDALTSQAWARLVCLALPEALAAADEAVRRARALADDDAQLSGTVASDASIESETASRRLAHALAAQGTALTTALRFGDAVVVLGEEVRLFRALAGLSEDASDEELERAVDSRTSAVTNMASNLGTLGRALVGHQQAAAAVAAHREEVRLKRVLAGLPNGASDEELERAVDRRPRAVRNLALGLDRLGGALESHHQAAAAVAALREAVRLRRALAGLCKDVSDQQLQRAVDSQPRAIRELATSLGSLGNALRGRQQTAAAVAAHLEEVRLCRALAGLTKDASDEELQRAVDSRPEAVRELAIGTACLGLARTAAGRPRQAVDPVEHGLRLLRALSGLEPSAPDSLLHDAAERHPALLWDQAQALAGLASARRQTGDEELSLEAADESARLARALLGLPARLGPAARSDSGLLAARPEVHALLMESLAHLPESPERRAEMVRLLCAWPAAAKSSLTGLAPLLLGSKDPEWLSSLLAEVHSPDDEVREYLRLIRLAAEVAAERHRGRAEPTLRAALAREPAEVRRTVDLLLEQAARV